jgi:hypothetical protein
MVLQIGPAVSGLASAAPRGGAVWETVKPASFQRMDAANCSATLR